MNGLKWGGMVLFSLVFLVQFSCSGSTGEDEEVLVCLSEDAYAYHSNECMGFEQCDSDSEWISLDEAIEQGRTQCGFCY